MLVRVGPLHVVVAACHGKSELFVSFCENTSARVFLVPAPLMSSITSVLSGEKVGVRP